MSYTISIFSVPLPTDDSAVWAEFEAIVARHQDSDGAKERSPALCALVELLLARYPDLTSFEAGDPGAANSPWVSGPLINDVGVEMAQIGIVNSKIADVMPFLVAEALRLGLTVADDVSGEIFRPSTSKPLSPSYLTLDVFDSWEYPRDSEFCQWFAERYPDGVEMADLFAVIRADDARSFDPLEPLFDRVISSMDTTAQVVQLKAIIEADAVSSISKAVVKSGEKQVSACHSAADDSSITAQGDYQQAITAGKWSHAVTTGNFGYASSRGSASNAVASGLHSCAMTSGVASMAVATNTNSYAVAIDNYGSAVTCHSRSRSYSSGEAGYATALGGWSHATSTGSRAHAIVTGERSQACATGFLGNAVALGYCARARVSDRAVVAAALGPRGMAQASAGGAIVLGYYANDNSLVHVRASRVGENGIEPNTWYRLDANGEFEAVKD